MTQMATEGCCLHHSLWAILLYTQVLLRLGTAVTLKLVWNQWPRDIKLNHTHRPSKRYCGHYHTMLCHCSCPARLCDLQTGITSKQWPRHNTYLQVLGKLLQLCNGHQAAGGCVRVDHERQVHARGVHRLRKIRRHGPVVIQRDFECFRVLRATMCTDAPTV